MGVSYSVSAASRSERTVTARGMKAFFDVSGLLVSLRVLMGSTSVFFIGCLNQFPEIGQVPLDSVPPAVSALVSEGHVDNLYQTLPG